MLIKLILNTVKLLMKKKSYILIGIIMPAFIVVFFSFEFGIEYKYKVGIVDKDKSYASNEIIKSIDNLEDIETTKVKEKDYNILLITQQIEVAVIIDKGFEDNEEIEVVLRPEDLDIVDPGQAKIRGIVRNITFKGVHYEILIETELRTYMVHTTDYAEVGREVGLKFGPEDIHVMCKMGSY